MKNESQLFSATDYRKNLKVFLSASIEKESIFFKKIKDLWNVDILKSSHITLSCPILVIVSKDEEVSNNLLEKHTVATIDKNSQLNIFNIQIENAEIIDQQINLLSKVCFEKYLHAQELVSYDFVDKILNYQYFNKQSHYYNQHEVLVLNSNIETSIYEEIQFPKFLNLLEKKFFTLKIFKNLMVKERLELIEKINNPTSFFLPIIFSNQNEFIYIERIHPIDDYFYFGLVLLYQHIERYYKVHQYKLSFDYKKTLWDEALQEIPYPIALVTDDAELLKFNELFKKMNVLPSQCLQFKNHESVEIDSTVYLVKKKMTVLRNSNLSLVSFFPAGEKVDEAFDITTMTSQDLGIISSSVAHELNNPLAGILAAINLLELEEWQEEESLMLKEMKESASRCRDLIAIFLGFSRAKSINQEHGEIGQGLSQAIDLLRFRMIQDEARLEINYQKDNSFGPNLSLSLSTMVFYLILGELMTLFNHQRLIDGEVKKEIQLNVIENQKRLEIHYDKSLRIEKRVKESKLLHYLVNSLGLDIEVTSGNILMTTWMLV